MNITKQELADSFSRIASNAFSKATHKRQSCADKVLLRQMGILSVTRN